MGIGVSNMVNPLTFAGVVVAVVETVVTIVVVAIVEKNVIDISANVGVNVVGCCSCCCDVCAVVSVVDNETFSTLLFFSCCPGSILHPVHRYQLKID